MHLPSRSSFFSSHSNHREGSWREREVKAMPSLHFGYSLLIGLSVATIPLHGLAESEPLISARNAWRVLRLV